MNKVKDQQSIHYRFPRGRIVIFVCSAAAMMVVVVVGEWVGGGRG